MVGETRRVVVAWVGMLVLLALVDVAVVRCAPAGPVALTPQDVAEIGAYDYEQGECVELDAGLEARKVCVAAVRARWHAHWRSRFPDGGF